MNNVYTDLKGERPITGKILKGLIMGDSFFTAWWAVAIYILKVDLQPLHSKIMRHQYKHKKSLIMAGRGYGKSYVNSTAFTLTLALRDPMIKIAVATESSAQSKRFIRVLRGYFEEGSTVYNLFGNLKGSVWKETEFELKRPNTGKINKEATVTSASMGAGTNFISSHFDVIIMDDIVGEDNSRTKGEREKLHNFILSTVFPTLQSDNGYGWLHCIGTHYHSNDFWNTLQESGQFEVLKIKSLIKGKDGKYKSIWEEKKGVKSLLSERQFSRRTFNMQFQQELPDEKGNIFRGDWLQYFTKYSIVGGRVEVQVEGRDGDSINEKVRVYGGVDLAISQKASADSFVIAVIGIGDDTGNIYLLDMVRDKLSFGEQMEAIKNIGRKWDMIERIGIESVAYQQSLPDELIRTTSLPVVKIQTLKDKVTRMSKFSGQWENYKVYLNQHIREIHILEEETLDFPIADHDDTIDAFEIAWQTSTKNIIQTFDIDVASKLGF